MQSSIRICFDKYVNTDIEWPQDEEALSDEAVAAVELFLTTDPKLRPTAKDVPTMQFFESVDWENLESIIPPFVPNPENPTDTGYFEGTKHIFILQCTQFLFNFFFHSSKYTTTFEIIQYRFRRLEVIFLRIVVRYFL